MLGKQYEATKKLSRGGGDRRSEEAKNQNPQNADIDNPRSKTAKIIAKEYSVNPSTVERAEKFSKGLDRIAEHAPEP